MSVELYRNDLELNIPYVHHLCYSNGFQLSMLKEDDLTKLMTVFLSENLPVVLKEWDRNRNTEKELTARQGKGRMSGRGGRFAMPKISERYIENNDILDSVKNIIKDSIQEINRSKSKENKRKLKATFNSVNGLCVLFQLSLYTLAESKINAKIDIENGSHLQIRMQVLKKAKIKISKLYKNYYSSDMTEMELKEEFEEIMELYKNKNAELVTNLSLTEKAGKEKAFYDSLMGFDVLKQELNSLSVDLVNKAIEEATGVFKLFEFYNDKL